ncbi:MAG: TIGR00725 family protein [Candidatus Pacebacteria bacterium]|nr:TIGR00725 family protein [Candidatus Paceibacterota bacterium]
MQKRIQIGVIGYAGEEEYPTESKPPQNIYKKAEKVGFLLAKRNAVVVTGGKSGIMESGARGAKKAGGVTLGVIKGKKRFTSNDFTDVEVLSGMEADGFDEVLLVNMCDGFICIGGGAGTLEEITLAYRNNKPVVVLKGTGGWADKLAGAYLDERRKIKIESASDEKNAVDMVLKLCKKK